MQNPIPSLDKRNLYRFPWSLNDNPQGWVEITDVCNLKCQGCYRQRLEGHKSFDAIKEEIAFLKKWRNIDNISLAGGEPILHPQIVDIVAYISQQKLKPFMLGNGVAHNKPLLSELRKAGLVGVGLHVDMHQNRPGWEGKNELDLCALREELAELVWQVGGISCNFNSTIYRDSLQYVPDLVKWAIRNSRKVQGYTFMTYRGALIDGSRDYLVKGRKVRLDEESLGYALQKQTREDFSIMSTDVYAAIKAGVPQYAPSVYLGGTKKHTSFKWLDAMMLCCNGRPLGSFGKKAMEFSQAIHHLLFGTYILYFKSKSTGRIAFLLSLFDSGVRQALLRYLHNPLNLFRTVHLVGIAIVQAPDSLDGDVDMCESCPDITVFEGRLVNSCRLDEYRKFGDSLTPSLKTTDEPAIVIADVQAGVRTPAPAN
jgi:Radical SAM superfamily/4Fe-4S single cluster domain